MSMIYCWVHYEALSWPNEGQTNMRCPRIQIARPPLPLLHLQIENARATTLFGLRAVAWGACDLAYV